MRRVILSAAVGLALTVMLDACAAAGTAASAPGSTRQSTVQRRNVITSAELAENPDLQSVMDAVRRLRPNWPSQVTVFMDNDLFGDFDSLRNVTARQAKEIRFLTASEAQMKWGSRYREVIQIITR
ncbi:MAG TPA: hypothetical protein VF178_05715 [Gemmatimonadaceae bacterium]